MPGWPTISTPMPIISLVSASRCCRRGVTSQCLWLPLGDPYSSRSWKPVANDISLAELAAAIALGMLTYPPASWMDWLRLQISLSMELVTADTWHPLIVAYRNGTPLRIQRSWQDARELSER